MESKSGLEPRTYHRPRIEWVTRDPRWAGDHSWPPHNSRTLRSWGVGGRDRQRKPDSAAAIAQVMKPGTIATATSATTVVEDNVTSTSTAPTATSAPTSTVVSA